MADRARRNARKTSTSALQGTRGASTAFAPDADLPAVLRKGAEEASDFAQDILDAIFGFERDFDLERGIVTTR